ncbi:MAG: RNA methyltransferase [Salinivirgaceae bacterium]|nr:MAG: RNA methyltransferase [Salinivirgaceae bacterium]
MENTTIKFLKSLQQKKFRNIHNEFIVEGVKMVNELIQSEFKVKAIYATDTQDLITSDTTPILISDKELSRISGLKSPNKVLAVVEIPEPKIKHEELKDKLSIVLENIQDPGNLGTIIRIANWYGIENILCSEDTVECYNPKVTQATMGAIFRVKVHYCDIYSLIEKAQEWQKFNVYATHLSGDNIHDKELNNSGFIIMGNESKGISKRIKDEFISKIKLPSYPPNDDQMESLNVAIATAITVAEFRRRII